MRKRVVILLCILSLLSGQLAVPTYAAMSTPKTIVFYSAIVLGSIESINLIVRAAIYLSKKNRKIRVTPPLQTNIIQPPVTNMIATATTNSNIPLITLQTNTNIISVSPAVTNTNLSVVQVVPQTNTNRTTYLPVMPPPVPMLISPEAGRSTTNRTITFSWLPVTNDAVVTYRIVTDQETNIVDRPGFVKEFFPGTHFWKVQSVVQQTNRSVWSEGRRFQITTNIPLFVSTSIFSNLTESEKDDIRMFGADYYYLVSLAYYGVKKFDKSREFMFHSLAIGSRVVEGTLFLKETMNQSDKDIANGVAKYRRSR